MDTNRIDHILNPDALAGKRLVIVGLGSVGFPVMQNMAMCGVSDWVLVDCDRLDVDNLVKHPAMRKDLGRLKTEIAEEWVMDRNPNSKVKRIDKDITSDEGKDALRTEISNSDGVICCTDTKNSRLLVNRACLGLSKPCVTGVVYRTGFGGDAFAYEPGVSGCYDCFLDRCNEVSIGRLLDDSRALSEIEEKISEEVYGKQVNEKYGLSGLSMDIQMTALLVSRLSLPVLIGESIDESMRALFLGGGPQLTLRENNLPWLPYDVRGPSKPPLPEEKTVWLDTTSGKRWGLRPHCGNCLADAFPHNIYCHNCGFYLSWSDSTTEGWEDATSFPDWKQVQDEPYDLLDYIHECFQINYDDPMAIVVREWEEIGPPRDGLGVHHVSFFGRRHLIDEIQETSASEKTSPASQHMKTGNARVATQPFTMFSNPILPVEGCEWCSGTPRGGA